MPGKSKKGGGLMSSPVYKKTPFKMKGFSGFGNSPLLAKDVKPGTEEKKKKDTVRKDMSTRTILEQQWAEYQASLPAGHPDKGKPAPKQID